MIGRCSHRECYDAQIKLGGALRDANSLEERTDQLEQELEDAQKALEKKTKDLEYKEVNCCCTRDSAPCG